MNLVGVLVYICMQLFPIGMSELVLMLFFEAYSVFFFSNLHMQFVFVFILFYYFFRSAGIPLPGRLQHSALELHTSKVCVFPPSGHDQRRF